MWPPARHRIPDDISKRGCALKDSPATGALDIFSKARAAPADIAAARSPPDRWSLEPGGDSARAGEPQQARCRYEASPSPQRNPEVAIRSRAACLVRNEPSPGGRRADAAAPARPDPGAGAATLPNDLQIRVRQN